MRLWWTALGLAVACKPAPEPPLGDLPPEGQRIRVPEVSFEGTWTDYVTLEGALDADCRFLEPVPDDWSTTWSPLQVYWVIYDFESDVRDGDRIEDTFFDGDLVLASDYADRNGKSAFGFKFLPPLQQSFVRIDKTEVKGDGHEVQATFGAPIDALMAVEADLQDGGCVTEARYCPLPCDDPQLPLSRIDIALAGLFVEDVVFFD